MKGVADELQAFTIRMAREGHAPQYIANFVKSVRAWLRHNDIGMVRKISIGDAGARPTVENERLPTRSEVHDILIAGNPRAKVIVSLCAFAGVRTEVVGYYRAKDGLRLSDLPELRTCFQHFLSPLEEVARTRPSAPVNEVLTKRGRQRLPQCGQRGRAGGGAGEVGRLQAVPHPVPAVLAAGSRAEDRIEQGVRGRAAERIASRGG